MHLPTTRHLAAFTLAALVAAGCGGSSDDAGSASRTTIRIDGSSTVAPLSEAAAEGFQSENEGMQVTVGTSGTGGGFEKFCAGEVDIADASRPIKQEEIAACEDAGVEYHELQVANDGLAVVVNTDNDWVDCLTVEQLNTIWAPDSKVGNWSEVDPGFPDEELTLFGAGTDSGTFDYFTEAINGEEGASRTDYNATEDDNVTVQGVSGNRGGLGYFGLSYAEENADAVRAVPIDGGDGCVEPTVASVQSGEYIPLSRPLFIYASDELVSSAHGADFLRYYAQNAATIAEQALFVPLTAEQNSQLTADVDALTGDSAE